MSEYCHRESVPHPRSLVLVISQSGETADTLAALFILVVMLGKLRGHVSAADEQNYVKLLRPLPPRAQ